MRNKYYPVLLLFTVLSAVAGIISLLPWSAASYENILGYKSLCTFNPASALFCFMIAGNSCFIRSTFFKFETGTTKEKLQKHKKSLIPITIIFILAIITSGIFIKIDSQYTDGMSGATIHEEEES